MIRRRERRKRGERRGREEGIKINLDRCNSMLLNFTREKLNVIKSKESQVTLKNVYTDP